MAIKCLKCQTENTSDSKFCKKCATPLPSSKAIPVSQTETLQTLIKELITGSTFAGRYQVIEELGKGGMGKVYKVYDTDIKEKVALKLLKPEIASDRETIERFSNELKYARKIRHKNVCGMYDLGKAEGTHFITMEYISGEDLKSMIRMSRTMSVGAILGIGKQVCEGLAEAHGLGVVHRDLKPQNIMIDKGGNAKIMDFGIARSLRERGITGPSMIIGTPEYMSPEQAEAKEVDRRSDIYSLGIILYEMATGRVPFEGETALSVAMKHKGEVPKNPKEFNPNIPDDLSGVILKCLEKDRANRYQTAAEVGTELEKIEKGIPTTDRVVPERITPTRKPFTSKEITVKFQPRKIIIPAILLVLLIAAGLFFLLKPRSAGLDPKRVAVVPFENKTGDPKLDNIGFMASDWITQGLMQANVVAVSSPPATDAFKDIKEEKDKVRLIAKTTLAGKIITGSYYLEGETMRFAAQVLDARQGKLISAVEPVGGAAKEPVKIIEILRQKVMGVIAVAFDTKRTWSVSGYIPSYEAYQAYVEGIEAFFRLDYSRTIDLCYKALQSDPNFIRALITIAQAYANSRQYAKSEKVANQIMEMRDKLTAGQKVFMEELQARLKGDSTGVYRADKRMSELDPIDSAYNLGWSALWINRPREAISAFKRANPESPTLKGWVQYWGLYAFAHHMLGEHKKELNIARRARKLYPERHDTLALEIRAFAVIGKIKDVNRLIEESRTFPPQASWDLSQLLFFTGRELRAHGYREESMEFLERGIQWLKSRPESEIKTEAYRNSMASLLCWVEKWQEAKTWYEALATEFPDNLDYKGFIGLLTAKIGNLEEAQRISDEMGKLERPYLFGLIPYWQACISAALGDKEKALKLLQESIVQGGTFASFRYHANIALEPLADYPPFKEFIKPKG